MSIAWLLGSLLWMAWWGHSAALRRELAETQKQLRQANAERQHLQNRLNIRSQHLDYIMDAIQEVVIRLDLEGMVLSLNQQAKHTFSYSAQLQFPQPMVVLHRDSDWLEALNQALHQLPEHSHLPELFIQGKVYLPRLSALGEQQAILLCLDITEAYRMQEQRKAFTANLMHDLKTPLTSLLGYARSIESFYDDEDLCRESAAVIAKEAKHVNDLLNELLSVEQIEQGAAHGASCDAASICQHVWKIMEHECYDKGLKVILDVDEPCLVAMPESDVTRIILNIASNAVRYTQENTTIHCSLHQHTLTIEDEGLGVPEKDLPHLCERFYRVDDVRSQGSGHGLGLAIVKETLERDGGSLHIENRDEGGLSVSIQFPPAEEES